MQRRLNSMIGNLLLMCSVFAVVSAECKPPPYIALRNVKYIPRSEKEVAARVNCTSTKHKAICVISTLRNETLVLCACEVVMFGGYCPEVNIGNKIQENYNAPCRNLSSNPCPLKYKASQSYKFPGCFEIFGGISSPKSLVMKNELLEGTIQQLKADNEKYLTQLNRIITEKNNTIKMLKNRINDEKEKFDQKEIIYIGVVAFLIVILISMILYWFIKQYCCDRKSDETNNSKLLINYCKKDQTINSEPNQRMLDAWDSPDNENKSSDKLESNDIEVEGECLAQSIMQDGNVSVDTDMRDGHVSDHTDMRDGNVSDHTDMRDGNVSDHTDMRDGNVSDHTDMRDGNVSDHTDMRDGHVSDHTDMRDGNVSDHTDMRDGNVSDHTDMRDGHVSDHTDMRDGHVSDHTDMRDGNVSDHTDMRDGHVSDHTDMRDGHVSDDRDMQDGNVPDHTDMRDGNVSVHTDIQFQKNYDGLDRVLESYISD